MTRKQYRDFVDEDGENRAVRTFLSFYSNTGITIAAMRQGMEIHGWDDCWPSWVTKAQAGETLTKSGAQAWIRHLFSLESSPANAR